MVFMFDTEKILEQQLKEVEQWHVELPKESSSESGDFPALVSTQHQVNFELWHQEDFCLLYTSPSPRDRSLSRMPSSA